jgi:hypothetical protein
MNTVAGKPEQKRELGKPKCRCQNDNIKLDLKIKDVRLWTAYILPCVTSSPQQF